MMSKALFLLQNQDNYYLGKHSDWVDGRDPKELFKTPYRDVAINHLFEVNAHDYQQRIQVVECEVKGHNTPALDPENLPPPLPKKSPEPAETETQNLEEPERQEQSQLDLNPESVLDSELTEQAIQYQPDNIEEVADSVEPREELLVQEV